MDQEVEIINNNTRIEKMKNFFVNYKKQLIILMAVIVLSLFGFFWYEEYKFGNKVKLANKYNNIITKFEINQKENASSELKEINDSIASAANYLNKIGWNNNEICFIKVDSGKRVYFINMN